MASSALKAAAVAAVCVVLLMAAGPQEAAAAQKCFNCLPTCVDTCRAYADATCTSVCNVVNPACQLCLTGATTQCGAVCYPGCTVFCFN